MNNSSLTLVHCMPSPTTHTQTNKHPGIPSSEGQAPSKSSRHDMQKQRDKQAINLMKPQDTHTQYLLMRAQPLRLRVNHASGRQAVYLGNCTTQPAAQGGDGMCHG